VYTNPLTRRLIGVKPIPALHHAEKSWTAICGRHLTILIVVALAIGLGLGFQFSLQVITLAGFLAAIAGLRWPNVGLFGTSILCVLDTVSRVMIFGVSGFFRYNTFNYWLLVVILFSLPLLVSFKDPHTRLLQCFLMLVGLEIVISAAWDEGLQHLLNIVTIFGLMCYCARARNDINVWYWVGIINGTLGAAGGFVFYLQKAELPAINSNAWAYFPLTAIFAICLSLFVASKKMARGQILLGSLATVNYVWVFLSGSRGGLVVASACILFILTVTGKLRTRLVYVSLLVIVIALGSVFFTGLKDNSVSRMQKSLDTDQSYVSRTSGRSDLALAAWYMFLDHPFGIGTGGFASARISQGYAQKTSGWEANTQMEAHAGWMKTLAENGVPGILLQIAFVFSFAAIGWRMRRQGVFSLGLLVTLTLSLAFITTEVQTKGLWFLAASAIVFIHRKKDAPQFYSRDLRLLGRNGNHREF